MNKNFSPQRFSVSVIDARLGSSTVVLFSFGGCLLQLVLGSLFLFKLPRVPYCICMLDPALACKVNHQFVSLRRSTSSPSLEYLLLCNPVNQLVFFVHFGLKACSGIR
ncbi:unnamed protein product [Cuscuta europaea]|uniref:Uncharacterized protein n=1 Tax=Cuscuta europaea TaxID=41803 RepID=A0A9P1E7N6_CUSEU|nr:unnamed protein product [Cuscuta europaea]